MLFACLRLSPNLDRRLPAQVRYSTWHKPKTGHSQWCRSIPTLHSSLLFTPHLVRRWILPVSPTLDLASFDPSRPGSTMGWLFGLTRRPCHRHPPLFASPCLRCASATWGQKATEAAAKSEPGMEYTVHTPKTCKPGSSVVDPTVDRGCFGDIAFASVLHVACTRPATENAARRLPSSTSVFGHCAQPNGPPDLPSATSACHLTLGYYFGVPI
jgi:hypothetical protein